MTNLVSFTIALLLIFIPPVLAQQLPQDSVVYTTFNTKGHPKAHGLSISIRYPSTWIAKEGKGPHVVQNFVNTTNLQFCVVQIAPDSEAGVTDDTFTYLKQDDLHIFLPDAGQLLSGQITKLDSIPGVILKYKHTYEQAGILLTMYSTAYITHYAQNMIMLQCGVSSSADSPDLFQKFEESQPQFIAIGNSLTIQDRLLNTASLSEPGWQKNIGLSEPAMIVYTIVSIMAHCIKRYISRWYFRLPLNIIIFIVGWVIALGFGVSISNAMQDPALKMKYIGQGVWWSLFGVITGCITGRRKKEVA